MVRRKRRGRPARLLPAAGAAFFLLLACHQVAQAQPAAPREAQERRRWWEGEIQRHWESNLARFESYVAALNRFGGPSPAEWRKGVEALRALPAHLWAPDRELVERALSDPEARRELARRGRVYELGAVFTGEYDALRWQITWERIRELGPSAVEYVAETLLRQLLSTQRRTAWDGARFYLVESGEPGRTMALAAADMLAADLTQRAAAEATVVSHTDLSQVVQVLIAFGDETRAKVEALARHRCAHVRASVASALGEARDPAGFGLLAGLAVDPDWAVRATAAAALGLHRYARAEAARTLSARLAAESHPTVKLKILESMGMLQEPETVPPMLAALDQAEREWNSLMARLVTERRRLRLEEVEAAVRRQREEVAACRRAKVDAELLRALQRKEAELQPLLDASMEQKDLMQKLMLALWKVTDQRLNTPAKWRAWAESRPAPGR
jgi:HEAT repeat protein